MNSKLSGMAFAALLFAALAASAQTTTVHVIPVAGDPVASGAGLVSALAGITTASASNPYVLKLDPGIYDVGVAGLQMKPYVDIEGSGQQSTILRGPGGSGPALMPVVNGAAPAELRDLQVLSMGGGGQNSIAVYLYHCATSLRDVTLVANNGSLYSMGLLTDTSGATLANVTITANSPQAAYGIYSSVDTIVLRRAVINVTSGKGSYGIAGFDSPVGSFKEVRDAEINASGGSLGNYGVYINNSSGALSFEIDNSNISALSNHVPAVGISLGNAASSITLILARTSVSGFHGFFGTGSSYGVQFSLSSGNVYADQSVISGLTQSISAPNASAYVGSSRLSGPVGAAAAHCAASYNGSWVALGPGCV